jgi:hypothetical protein
MKTPPAPKLNLYGFKAVLNRTLPGVPGNPYSWWVSPWHYGLSQGPIALLIETIKAASCGD